jgi:citrate lyase beta subunit
MEAAVEDRTKVYDAIRTALDKLIDAVSTAVSDKDQFFRYTIQSRGNGTEDRILRVINGRNLADVAKSLVDIVNVARSIDGIIDAATLAKLEIERERLELEKRKAGLSDDGEIESGIALMPEVDESLLNLALPDPDQPWVV